MNCSFSILDFSILSFLILYASFDDRSKWTDNAYECTGYSNTSSSNSTFSHWGATARPTTLTWDPSDGPNITAFTNPSSAVIHAFHGSHWGGWMFRVLSQDFDQKTFTLDPLGGQQEARGQERGRGRAKRMGRVFRQHKPMTWELRN